MIVARTIVARTIVTGTIVAGTIVTGRRGEGMQRDNLESSILEKSQRTVASSTQFDGALDKLAGEIRQAKLTIDLPRQLRKRLGALALLFGEMEVVRHFQDHGDLRRQGAGAANVLLRDARAVETVKHAEHAEQPSLGSQ